MSFYKGRSPVICILLLFYYYTILKYVRVMEVIGYFWLFRFLLQRWEPFTVLGQSENTCQHQ